MNFHPLGLPRRTKERGGFSEFAWLPHIPEASAMRNVSLRAMEEKGKLSRGQDLLGTAQAGFQVRLRS